MKNQQLIGLFKALVKKYQLPSQENNHIKFNVEQIRKILAPNFDIKKYQNYGETNLYTFDNKQIDLFALKYVTRKVYNEFSENIDKHHQSGSSCLVCQIKRQIYVLLRLTYKSNITFTDLKDSDSIIIYFSEQTFKYVIKIKVIISSRSYLALTCKNQYYCQLIDLYLHKKYKILNKLTNNWLRYLLFLLKIVNLKNEADYQLSKLIIVSYLDKYLWKDKWFSLWISNNFNHLFKDKSSLDDLIEQDHFSRKYNSLTNRLFKLYRYDNLKFVYQKKFVDFISFYTALIEEVLTFINNKTLELNLLIKMNLIILNSKWNSKITFHDKKNYVINHQILSRLVYNKKLDHNNFIVHLIYLQQQINGVFNDVTAIEDLDLLMKESKTMNLYSFVQKINEMILTKLGGEKDEK